MAIVLLLGSVHSLKLGQTLVPPKHYVEVLFDWSLGFFIHTSFSTLFFTLLLALYYLRRFFVFEASVTPASAVNFELMLATQLLAALVETDLLIN